MATMREQLEAKYGTPATTKSPAVSRETPAVSIRAQLEAKYKKPKTYAEKSAEMQSQGQAVATKGRFNRTGEITPSFGGNIVRGIARIPVEGALTVARGFGGLGSKKIRENGLTVKSKFLGDTKDYATSVEDTAKELADRVNKGEISKGRAVVGVLGASAEKALDLASVVPAGAVLSAGKTAVAQGAKGVARESLKGATKTALKRSGTLAGGYDIAQQAKEGEGYNPLRTVGAVALGTVADVGLSNVLPRVVSRGTKAQKNIKRTEKELLNIENNYQKLRKNAKFSKDGNSATRSRVAKSGVLSDVVDPTGTIITDNAVKKYRELSGLNKTEGVVRNNLERLGETIDLNTLEQKLKGTIYRSGLQGANLKNALNSVDNEIAGYRMRANPDGKVPLTLVHDAKIDTYNSIDFNTPSEIKQYKKLLARGLKESVEDSSSFNVKQVNDELTPFLKDVEYLESLNGRKVKGGKLGKYSARIAGNIAGGIAGGSVGGFPGSAIGTIVGGEVGDIIQGKVLKNTFGSTPLTNLPESEILKRAVVTGNSPRLQLPAPAKNAPRIRIESGRTINLPSRTQSTVDAQSLANLKAQKIAPPSKMPSKVSISKTIPEKKTKPKLSLKDQRGFIATGYKETGNLTTKILKDLEGKTTVSKQYILDATNRGELKQVERDLIRDIVSKEGDTVNVADFAKKVKAELLPLKVNKARDMYSTARGGTGGRYENIALPDDLRGSVKNYEERIYESPIKTSAGEVHFGQPKDKVEGYFGHTRIEDMADNKTRRVIEVQSDLYQKGNLEREVADSFDPAKTSLPKEKADKLFDFTKRLSGQGENLSTKEVTEYRKLFDEAKTLHENTVVSSRNKELSKLQQYNDPTAHFRMIREEIKKASEDGKTKLQFPTGETAMKIEGLGENTSWTRASTYARNNRIRLDNSDMKVGLEINDGNSDWIITDVLGDGKFKAVPKDRLETIIEDAGIASDSIDVNDWVSYAENHRNIDLSLSTEQFDISGKVDTNNPIYKFYEKDVQKYLNKFGGKRIVDDKGVSWIEVPIKKEYGDEAVEAFGKIGVSPLFAGAGIGLAGVTIAGLAKSKLPARNKK